MSLHALAGHMAAKGRGPDSMLVHMTPEEVQSLQVLALRAGGTLTINPETGLPEASFLKKMLPMIAGFALGPAGFGLMSAGMAGAAVGGITALSTGSLSRGLMAGLGAYGGASLGAGLTSAGQGAMAAGDIAAQQAAGTFPTLAEGASQEAVANYANQVNALRDTALSKAGEAGIGAKLAAGAGQMASNPGMYARELMTGLAAVSPMMADEGVQTTTKRSDTGTIRNYTFDPYGQTYTSAGNYPASEYKGMADGGVVALAAGGDYRSLTKDSSAEDIASAYKQFTTAGGGDTQANQAAALQYLGNLGIDQDRIGQAYTQFQAAPTYTDYTQQNVADYIRDNKNIDIAAETARLNANPFLVNQTISQMASGFIDPTQTTGGSGTLPYYDAYTQSGIDANELFAANLALDPNYTFDGKKGAEGIAALQRAFDTAGSFKGFDPQGENQLAKDIEWVKKMDAEGQTVKDIARLTGLSLNEVAAREAAAREAMKPKIITKPPVIPGNITTVGDLPGGVSGGGNTYVNPNGTITTRPNIPGMPEGGFTGMGQVRDAYTAGGGSLGYVNKAPTTMEEFDQRFNRQTGDSLAAYEYLMGKGANNNAYPTKSGVDQIMRPYSEVTTGIPAAEGRPTQKYIFDAATKRYVENPNYRPLSYNSKGERVVGLTPSEVLKGLEPFKAAADDAAMFDFVTQNNISEAQLAAALGISLAEARARLAAAKKVKDATTKSTTDMNDIYGGSASDGSEGGGPAGGPGGGPGSGTGTGADSPGASGSADGSAGGCVDPNVMVLLAGGGQVRAGDLRVGDMLHTLHEDTFVYGDFPVEFVEIIQQPKVEAVFDDQKIIVSTTHKFLTADGVWKQMRDLAVGDVVRAAGADTKTLTGVITLGEGPVVKMTVTDAHTYIADGLVSHNKARGGIVRRMALGGLGALAGGGSASQYNLGSYSDGGRLLRGPGDGVSDSIPATIGGKQPARLADGEFVIPARIVSELGNGSTEAGARKLYAMMDRVQKARRKTTGKKRVAANTRADKYLPA